MNKNPEIINIKQTIIEKEKKVESKPKLNKKEKSKKLVNPVKPYNKMKPNNKKEDDIAPKIKYFNDDSAANIENLCVAANK